VSSGLGIPLHEGKEHEVESAGLTLIGFELMLWVTGTMSAIVIGGAAFGWH
jgi:hypothetical protein